MIAEMKRKVVTVQELYEDSWDYRQADRTRAINDTVDSMMQAVSDAIDDGKTTCTVFPLDTEEAMGDCQRCLDPKVWSEIVEQLHDAGVTARQTYRTLFGFVLVWKVVLTWSKP